MYREPNPYPSTPEPKPVKQVDSIPMDGNCMFDTMRVCVAFYVKSAPQPPALSTLNPEASLLAVNTYLRILVYLVIYDSG